MVYLIAWFVFGWFIGKLVTAEMHIDYRREYNKPGAADLLGIWYMKFAMVLVWPFVILMIVLCSAIWPKKVIQELKDMWKALLIIWDYNHGKIVYDYQKDID